jgi:hypothetical protein
MLPASFASFVPISLLPQRQPDQRGERHLRHPGHGYAVTWVCSFLHRTSLSSGLASAR